MDRHALRLEWIDVERRRIVDQAEAALRRDQLDDLGEMLVGVGGREDERRRAEPERRDFGRERFRMVDDVVGAELERPSRVSGREAVAITVASVSWRASWIAIEPTPPAPPTISSRFGAPGTGWRMASRSNSISQAVTAVSGSAAASIQSSLAGLRPTMRSSTRWNSALAPGARDRAGVEHRVARLERPRLGSDRDHRSGDVPAEHFPAARPRPGRGGALLCQPG